MVEKRVAIADETLMLTESYDGGRRRRYDDDKGGEETMAAVRFLKRERQARRQSAREQCLCFFNSGHAYRCFSYFYN